MNKKIWKVALAFALPWTVVMTIIKSITNGGFTIELFLWTAMGGLIAGFIFSFIMDYSATQLYKKNIVNLDEDERIIKEGGANYFKGKAGVGGKLVLTEKRLIFNAHKSNVQNPQDSIDLIQISSAKATKTLNLFANGLTIEFVNNEKHKFVVDEPNEWVSALEKQKTLSNL